MRSFLTEARIKKPGNPKAKCSYDTKKSKKEKKEKKHKGKVMHEGVQLLEDTLDDRTLKALKTLAKVTEENIEITDNGFRFTFENSNVANFCRVVKYHDNIILEMRKQADDVIQGTFDRLVFEQVIKVQEFKDVFQNVTGIFLDYI